MDRLGWRGGLHRTLCVTYLNALRRAPVDVTGQPLGPAEALADGPNHGPMQLPRDPHCRSSRRPGYTPPRRQHFKACRRPRRHRRATARCHCRIITRCCRVAGICPRADLLRAGSHAGHMPRLSLGDCGDGGVVSVRRQANTDTTVCTNAGNSTGLYRRFVPAK